MLLHPSRCASHLLQWLSRAVPRQPHCAPAVLHTGVVREPRIYTACRGPVSCARFIQRCAGTSCADGSSGASGHICCKHCQFFLILGQEPKIKKKNQTEWSLYRGTCCRTLPWLLLQHPAATWKSPAGEAERLPAETPGNAHPCAQVIMHLPP